MDHLVDFDFLAKGLWRESLKRPGLRDSSPFWKLMVSMVVMLSLNYRMGYLSAWISLCRVPESDLSTGYNWGYKLVLFMVQRFIYTSCRGF